MRTNRLQIVQVLLTSIVIVLLVLNLIPAKEMTVVNAAIDQVRVAAAVPGGPGYLMVPATAFIAEESTDAYTTYWGELAVPVGAPNGYTHFNAPVYLPQGATITNLVLYYTDTISDTNTLGVNLRRKQVTGSDSGTDLTHVWGNQIGWNLYQVAAAAPPLSHAVVDNSDYSYYLSLYIFAAPAHLNLKGVRIDYTYNVSMPVFSY